MRLRADPYRSQITGKCRGNVVLIPRIDLEPDEGTFPFSWSRPALHRSAHPRHYIAAALPLLFNPK